MYLDKNAVLLSNHPNKEKISEFISKCTSTAEESQLSNLFDWKSNSCWTSENPNGVVRNQFLYIIFEYLAIVLICFNFPALH